jgi:hypothetical protein
MLRTLAAIQIGAIGLALFACYILPTVIGWLILVTVWNLAPSLIEKSTVAVGLLLFWALFLAPVVAGYLVARLAKVLPLVHGLVVSLVGSGLYVIYMTLTGNAGLMALWVIPPVMLAGLCGAWFYRHRSRSVAVEL